MSGELTRRVSRLEDHLPPNAKRRGFLIWMEPYEDWESIKTRAREKVTLRG